MCQPCCDNTYVKYLEADNSVDPQYLAKLGTNVTITHIPDMNNSLTQWLLDRGEQPPIITTVTIDDESKPFCMCACHRKDLCVCH